tara:strand:- start:25 stop:219 length:195 start_codon:yes stop_codon:yes gene_type:complete
MKIPSIKEQQQSIEYELADLQCLESCLEQGFTISDWVKHKSDLLEFMRDRLIHHIKIQQQREIK